MNAQMKNGVIAPTLNFIYLFGFVTSLILKFIQVDTCYLYCDALEKKKKIFRVL